MLEVIALALLICAAVYALSGEAGDWNRRVEEALRPTITCANCGHESDRAVLSESLYDGEACCSDGCAEEHDRLGCPLEHGMNYRPCRATIEPEETP